MGLARNEQAKEVHARSSVVHKVCCLVCTKYLSNSTGKPDPGAASILSAQARCVYPAHWNMPRYLG